MRTGLNAWKTSSRGNDYSLYGPADLGSSWDVLQDNSTYPVAAMDIERPSVVANTILLPTDAQFLIGAAVAEGWQGGATERGVVLSVTVDGSPETVFVDRLIKQPRLGDLPEPDLATHVFSWARTRPSETSPTRWRRTRRPGSPTRW